MNFKHFHPSQLSDAPLLEHTGCKTLTHNTAYSVLPPSVPLQALNYKDAWIHDLLTSLQEVRLSLWTVEVNKARIEREKGTIADATRDKFMAMVERLQLKTAELLAERDQLMVQLKVRMLSFLRC